MLLLLHVAHGMLLLLTSARQCLFFHSAPRQVALLRVSRFSTCFRAFPWV